MRQQGGMYLGAWWMAWEYDKIRDARYTLTRSRKANVVDALLSIERVWLQSKCAESVSRQTWCYSNSNVRSSS